MTPIRAKFVCESKTESVGGVPRPDGKGDTVWVQGRLWAYQFRAVSGRHGGSHENRLFWYASPSGSLALQAVREDLFEVGREYYLDFILAEEPAGVEA